jgi:hypothetical protein
VRITQEQIDEVRKEFVFSMPITDPNFLKIAEHASKQLGITLRLK